MIVRLKVANLFAGYEYITPFQFYDSPIKSGSALLARCDNMLFQFYDSPIKRGVYERRILVALNKFQFYDSPIKSGDYESKK